MAQPGGEQSWAGLLPGGLLIAILAGLGAVGWLQTPFQPDRPAEEKAGVKGVGIQDVDARLWQDPFAAVAAARHHAKEAKSANERCWTAILDSEGKTILQPRMCPPSPDRDTPPAATDPHSCQGIQDQIKSRSSSVPVTVLAVMVSAGPSSGAAEARRRQRYATLSALMLEAYLPEDAEHIGYVDLKDQGAAKGLPEFVPYEWFHRTPIGNKPEDITPRALLLLWLEYPFRPSPLRNS